MNDKKIARRQQAKIRTARTELQQSLQYQLGTLVVLLRKFRTWPAIPATLRRIARARKGLNVTPADVQRYASTDGLRISLSRVGPNALYSMAARIGRESGWAMAAEFIAKYGRGGYDHAVHLFRANEHLAKGHESAWLQELNAYLEASGLSPVQLVDTPGSRFSRLRGTPSTVVEDGNLVTVIMPTFNAAATVEHAANSILAQTWRNLELILVDDCSTDETWAVLQRLAAADSRVKILRNAVNVGPYVSKNLAFRIAQGKYMTGHDADDWAHPERLENDVAVIEESGGYVLAILSATIRMNDNGEIARFNTISPASEDGVSRSAAISLLIDADYFRKHLGAWDTVRFSADGELNNRVREILGNRFQVLSHIGMFVLIHAASLSSDPVHGFTALRGRSMTRTKYANAYGAWHARIEGNSAKIPFPHSDRLFPAPKAMLVPADAIQANIRAHDEQLARLGIRPKS